MEKENPLRFSSEFPDTQNSHSPPKIDGGILKCDAHDTNIKEDYLWFWDVVSSYQKCIINKPEKNVPMDVALDRISPAHIFIHRLIEFSFPFAITKWEPSKFRGYVLRRGNKASNEERLIQFSQHGQQVPRTKIEMTRFKKFELLLKF